MYKIDDINIDEQKGIKKILDVDPSSLTSSQILHLRARRGYLTYAQKYKYLGVLYFSRPALHQELKSLLRFLLKYAKRIILWAIGIIAGYRLLKYFGW